ncbi:MAG TPA: T9SS type A sorting domain-containing protein [Candidatus Kapabacteria bacterium]|nr:T9SS type A sorting domain-containing protein [Candidatus Kapabacteria bacterium]
MKQILFLFIVLLIGTYTLYGQKIADEDPYLLWATKTWYNRFIIHPNGNIIASRGAVISELDGNTGEVIKSFPQFVHTSVEYMCVSKDGKILGAGFGNIILYDLKEDTVIGGVSETNGLFEFFPDNKRFLARTTYGGDSNLMIYNLDTKEKLIFGIHYLPTSIATSPDGKYFATGGSGRKGKDWKGDYIYYTYLTLWDAQTLKPIKELDKFEGNLEVRSIKFSPDGKYVGFQISSYYLYLYKLDDLALFKFYDENFIEFGVSGFCFIGNDYIITRTGSSIFGELRKLTLINLLSDMKIKTINSGKGGPKPITEKNQSKNSLIDASGQLFSFDLNKMLTSTEEPFKHNTFLVSFLKDTLILSDINSISNQITITISDISGRVIRKFNSPSKDSELQIPLKLNIGTYLIHIQDGNKEYSSKFLVSE